CLTSPDAAGEWQAKEVGTIDDPTKIPLPVDISINKDGTGLWVNTFMDGKTRYFDLSNPEQPKQTYERVTGKQVNMISQSWHGTRVYAPGQLGQGRRRQRPVRTRLPLGRQGPHPRVRGRLQQGEARTRAPHEARLQGDE